MVHPKWMHNGFMATLTLKNVPDDLYRRLKAQAAANRRSLNQEAIAQLLESTAHRREGDVDAKLRRLSDFRGELEAKKVWFEPDDIDRWIEAGRP